MSAVLFVGTYTQSLGHVDGKGKGIYAFSLDRATGALAPLAVTEGVGHNPSYLTCSRSTLYAVNETNAAPQEEGATKPTGFVKAFAIGDNGALKELNAQEAGGADSCHVALSPAGDFLTVANYSGGNLRLYPIDATDGSLGAPSDTHTFSGASMAVPDRQEAAHVHSTTWLTRKSDGAHMLIAADLGNDVAAQFVLNKAARKLEPNGAVPFAKRPAGSGPRHFAVHAALQVAYVLDELSSTVGVHPIDPTTGALSLESIQTVSMLPADFKGQTLGADIHVSTCGQFLYASNRGHDSIAGFRIDAAKQGALTPIGFTSTRGKAPRAFRIDGHWLLAANQNSDTIEVFQIDAQTGALTFTGHSVACPTPVSLAIAPSA